MPTRDLRSALVRTLVWLLSLTSACATDEDDFEASALEALVTVRDDALVRDDFERGTVAAPTWQKRGDVRVRIDAARSGAFGVQLGRRASLVARLDTRGRRELTLRFDARAVDLERGEVLVVELAIDGGWFLPIAVHRDPSWTTRTVALPRFAEDRDDVQVRFAVRASEDRDHARSFEGVLLDNVAITAELPPDDALDRSDLSAR